MPEDILELDQTEELEGEQPAEGAEEEQPAPGAEGEQAKEGEEEKPVVTSLLDPETNKVSKPIRAAVDKIKAENKSIGRFIEHAVFRAAEMLREFPRGIAEVRELRDKVEQMGGFSDIEEKIVKAGQFSEMADWFEKGDPAFVDDMVNSSPEGFAALAPVVMDRFRETNGEAWSSYIGRVVYGDLQAQDIPLYLMRLADVVKDKPEAVELLNTINTYLGGWKMLASKAPAAKATPKQAVNNGGDQRELNLRVREWGSEDEEVQSGLRRSNYEKALSGRVPNTEEKAVIKELFMTRSARLADQYFKDWRKVSQGYISRNDKAGYLRYMASIHRRVIPEAVTSAVTTAMKGSKAAAKKVAAPTGTKTPIKAAEGFMVVAKEPGTHEIDYGRTTTAMLMENKAILKKDGKKVMWR